MNPQACYRVIQTRDRRFDGRLFVGVTSTGIYCRPICAARTPKLENCQFFLSAAAAQEAGFRPCLRCRPETAPEFAAWRGTSNTVSRALELIAIGTLDDGEVNLGALAERVGVVSGDCADSSNNTLARRRWRSPERGVFSLLNNSFRELECLWVK